MKYLLATLVVFFGLLLTMPTEATTPNVTVDFNTTVRSIDKLAQGMDESAYGNAGQSLPSDSLERFRFTTLMPRRYRVGLAWSAPGDYTHGIGVTASGGAGEIPCPCSPDGDAYINAIKGLNSAQPVVIVPIKKGSATFTAADAAELVRHFNVTSPTNPIHWWIVANEPDNPGGLNMTKEAYTTAFNQFLAAMKAVDSTIEVGGPANAFYNTAFLDYFLNDATVKTTLDFVDFHQYGDGVMGSGLPNKPAAQLLSETSQYATNITDLRSRINAAMPARSAQVEIEVGEWNLDWDVNEPLRCQNFNTVWVASALGQILKSGGWSLPFATKNGEIGYVVQEDSNSCGACPTTCKDTAMPAYHGMGMWTGERVIRKVGKTLVTATTTLADVEVYASKNEKALLAINKNPTASRAATIDLGANTGNQDITVWRKDASVNQNANPFYVRRFTRSGNSTFDETLPPYSVTVFTIGGYEPTGCGDISQDGYVDATDQQMVAMYWGLAVGNPPNAPGFVDITNDGYVDISDMQYLSGQWGLACY